MKHIYSRGAIFLTALALAISVMPYAAAQTPDKTREGETSFFTVPEEPVITPVGEYVEGRIRVTDGTLWGYAGVERDVVIQPQFDQVEDFNLGTAKVTKDGKVGLLRWDGAYIFTPQYDELIDVNYGIYLGRRGDVWDLLSVAPISSEGGKTYQLYSDQVSASIYEGTVKQVILQSQDGTVTRIAVNAIPQLLESRRVPGWQFPLASERKAVFRDVEDNDWYDRWVNLAYSVGLMEGTGGEMFEPLRELTVAETLRMAACLESRALQDDFHLQSVSGSTWYRSSVTYCEAIGIIKSGQFDQEDYNRPITRAEMAHVFAATTPVRSIKPLSDPEQIKNRIPDVTPEDFAAEAIYGLYAKGIINGTDSQHSFSPETALTRAEAAAIVARIARPEQRITFW